MDTQQTYFNLAQVTFHSYTDYYVSPNTATLIENADESIEVEIKHIETPQTMFADGYSALCDHIDGVSLESVIEGFENTLIDYYRKNLSGSNSPVTCVVGIETTYSQTYYYEYGCYEYDSHAWITGIIDTSHWNAESFQYTIKHPDWKDE